MSYSQEQSLNQNVIFFPVNESNPEFHHCEVERCALECLLRDGSGAFYNKLSAEQLGPFLSSEEVNQVSSWAEDYHSNAETLENGDAGSESSSGMQDFSDQYFPTHSDTPPPCLELGWPEKDRWEGLERAMVYTNPPLEQAPHIREVIRRLLQGATTLIAIVADKVTDSMVIADLHSAASRDVAVYIILNQRSAQENLSPNRLKHPNINVRIVGGKTFVSRDLKMVVGELKENFVLVDLETVVLGSYSLTWTDAHLHRQLVTVMSGPVVELFDREFRILYAASLPIPDSWKADRPQELPKVDGTHNLYLPEPNTHKQVLLDCPSSPPPPITDSPLDWEALGVFQRKHDFPEDHVLLPEFCEELPKYHRAGLDMCAGAPGDAREPGGNELYINEWQDESKVHRVTAETRHLPDHQVIFRNMLKTERLQYGFMTEREERPAMFWRRDLRMERNLKEDIVPFSRAHRQDSPPNLDRSWGEIMIPEGTILGSVAATAHQKLLKQKPLILSLPQTDNSWNLSNILKKINSSHNTRDLQTKMAKNVISKSTLDLSAQGTETPQMSQPNIYDSFPITPALALMKKRNDELKCALLRNSWGVQPMPRPRSFSLGLQRDTRKPPFFREQRSDEDK